MGRTWFLSAQDGPHVGPMNLAIRVTMTEYRGQYCVCRWPDTKSASKSKSSSAAYMLGRLSFTAWIEMLKPKESLYQHMLSNDLLTLNIVVNVKSIHSLVGFVAFHHCRCYKCSRILTKVWLCFYAFVSIRPLRAPTFVVIHIKLHFIFAIFVVTNSFLCQAHA